MQAILLIAFTISMLVSNRAVNKQNEELRKERAALTEANTHLRLTCSGVAETVGLDSRDEHGVPITKENTNANSGD